VTDVVQHVVDALSVGSTYALLALGLTLVFSVMNLINFAYGMLLVWAGYAAIVMLDAGVPFLLTVPVCIVFATVLSIVIGWVAFRPFIGAPPITLLITSFGVLLVIQYIAILIFGERPEILRLPSLFGEVVEIAGVRIPVLELITIGTAVVVVAIFYALLNPDRVLMIAFAISGAIAGVVGLLWFAKVGAITPRADLDPTINAFIALVLGGLGSTRGALIGGLALGAIEVTMAATLPDGALGYQPAIVFAAVIAILIVRPGGLGVTSTEPAR
jgi:branched-chain amino acid transport system permease protein